MKKLNVANSPKPLLLLLSLLTTGCVSVPAQLQGEYPGLLPEQTANRDIGKQVRWGGVVLEAYPDNEKTCFEILSRALAKSMRPKTEDQTSGRFIACKSGFHDPEVFARGRELTLTGRIEEIGTRKVGDYDYVYPIVAAGFITMWPERPDVVVYDYYDPFYSPYYWHRPYFYPYHHYPYPYPRYRYYGDL